MSDKKNNLTLIFVTIPLLLVPISVFVVDFELRPSVFIIPVAAWLGARYSNAGVVVLGICLLPSLFYAGSFGPISYSLESGLVLLAFFISWVFANPTRIFSAGDVLHSGVIAIFALLVLSNLRVGLSSHWGALGWTGYGTLFLAALFWLSFCGRKVSRYLLVATLLSLCWTAYEIAFYALQLDPDGSPGRLLNLEIGDESLLRVTFHFGFFKDLLEVLVVYWLALVCRESLIRTETDSEADRAKRPTAGYLKFASLWALCVVWSGVNIGETYTFRITGFTYGPYLIAMAAGVVWQLKARLFIVLLLVASLAMSQLLTVFPVDFIGVSRPTQMIHQVIACYLMFRIGIRIRDIAPLPHGWNTDNSLTRASRQSKSAAKTNGESGWLRRLLAAMGSAIVIDTTDDQPPRWQQIFWLLVMLTAGACAVLLAWTAPDSWKLATVALVFLPPLWLLTRDSLVQRFSGATVGATDRQRNHQQSASSFVINRKRLLTMVHVEGGHFLMGSPDSDPDAMQDEMPQHRVNISGFTISTTAITQQQWTQVMTDDESAGQGIDPLLPRTAVSWRDTLDFCNKLSESEGLSPCYRFSDESGKAQVTCLWEADGYRLPTEAEWEYACRAGSQTPWLCDRDELTKFAWFDENCDRIQPVATREPNGFSLYDMAGNCYEWVWDSYRNYASDESGVLSDPQVDLASSSRVIRGGAFDFTARDLRSADRYFYDPGLRVDFLGFRCVRVPSASVESSNP